jgi:hypothetical protein
MRINWHPFASLIVDGFNILTSGQGGMTFVDHEQLTVTMAAVLIGFISMVDALLALL